mgnify:FL=1
MATIYLAGAIGKVSKKRAEEWREYFVTTYSYFVDRPDVINPIDFFSYDEVEKYTEREVLDWELSEVSKSDVLVVNLDRVTESVGTLQEMATAYTHHIPIIAFHLHMTEQEIKETLHPWIGTECTKIFTGSYAINKVADYVATYYDRSNH